MPTPIDNKREELTEEINGFKVSDPYRWLEDSDDPAVEQWIDKQNELVDEKIKGGQFEIFSDELVKDFQTTNFSTPLAVNGRYFYMERKPDQDQLVLYVKEGLDDEPTAIFDPNGRKEENTISINYWQVSRTGDYVAYGISEDGDEMATLYVYDVEAEERLSDEIINCRYSSISWLSDDSGFYYNRNPRPGEVPEDEIHMHPKVYLHTLGDDPSEDELIFGDGRPKDDMIHHSLSPDDTYLAINVSQDWTENDIYLYNTQTQELDQLISGDEFTTNISFLPDKALLYTSYEADNFRVLATGYDNLSQPLDEWREFIPEKEHVLQGFSVTSDTVLVEYLENVSSAVSVYDHQGNQLETLPLPKHSSLIGISSRRDEEEFFYSVNSHITSRTTYRFDPEEQAVNEYRQESNPINPDEYVVKQEWYESRDGTEVPMFIIHHEDITLDGSNPTVLYGYGGYGTSLTPNFSRSILPWLRRGGVHAIANIRGGGEFGDSWHKDGIKEKKTNSFDDFIAAGEHLIESGYTSSGHLGAEGGSNGGLLVAAAAIKRPSLFAAVSSQVPLTDIVRFHKFGMASRWVHEYGSPENADDLKYILDWSPYHNIESGEVYPHFLFTTAKQDTRVHPMHARKMAAQLQDENSDGDTFIYTEEKAGHGPGTPIRKIVEEQAIINTFFAQKLGLEV